MNVPESFFKGEIREGFYVEKLMKKVWAAQIEVLHDVDILCKKHNIQYFADFGTLLGAIRHKGFIPWDDDMDISMKRPDYIKFCEIVQKEMKGQYEIVNIHTDSKWSHQLTRIINSRDINFNEDRMKKFHGCPFSVGLDIFPMDYISSSKEDDDLQCQIIKILEITVSELENDNGTEEEKLNTIHAIEQMCGVRFDHNKSYIQQLRKLEENMLMLYKDEEATQITNDMLVYAFEKTKYVYPKEYFENTIEVPFEYTTIQVPAEYEKILIKEYGQDYMIPDIGSASHEYPFYKEQLDMIYEFNGNR